jgi:hypothetical protein
MSKRSSFGALTGRLESNYALGLPIASNRNLILSLPKNVEKQIFSVACSYNFINGVTLGATEYVGGRLIIIGAKLDDDEIEIFPDLDTLPDALQGGNVYFDQFIGAKNSGQTSISEHFQLAIRIPKDENASVILTYPYDDTTGADPASDIHLGRLSVQGITGGTEKIFKNIN